VGLACTTLRSVWCPYAPLCTADIQSVSLILCAYVRYTLLLLLLHRLQRTCTLTNASCLDPSRPFAWSSTHSSACWRPTAKGQRPPGGGTAGRTVGVCTRKMESGRAGMGLMTMAFWKTRTKAFAGGSRGSVLLMQLLPFPVRCQHLRMRTPFCCLSPSRCVILLPTPLFSHTNVRTRTHTRTRTHAHTHTHTLVRAH